MIDDGAGLEITMNEYVYTITVWANSEDEAWKKIYNMRVADCDVENLD